MKVTGRDGRQIVLLTMLVLIVPMWLFPKQFGTELIRPSLINAFYELVWYGLIIWIFNRRVSLIQLLQAGGACLVYRFALGALLGLLIAAVYGMNARIAVTLGMSSYLPGILLHIAVAPFILKPVIKQLYEPDKSEERTTERTARTQGAAESASRSSQRRTEYTPTASPRPQSTPAPTSSSRRASTPTPPQHSEVNAFERSVRYIGEHKGVDIACVVDHEGLLLANFRRAGTDAEQWAPLALLFREANDAVLRRNGLHDPAKIDLTLDDRRVIVACTATYSVLVAAERQSDDLLNIRINQALEMIAKYAAERYGETTVANAEQIHVSGTE